MKLYTPRIVPLLVAMALAACSDSSGPGGDDTFPTLLSELDIDQAEAQLFAPRFPLWTNGSDKERKILVPEGSTIDISNSARWQYPAGTRFTKTFSYRSPSGQTRKIETRVILRTETGWEFATYQWRDDQSEADLLDGTSPVAVNTTNPDGVNFDHLIPSRAQCQTCHGSDPAFILGFDELQLTSTLPGQSDIQLNRLATSGIFAQAVPGSPLQPTGTGDTLAIAGYIQGNCVHCHNGTTQFDMREPGFLTKVVGVESTIGQLLIAPGQPDSSRIYNRFSGGAMPPLGVQVQDDATAEVMRRWIAAMQ